MTGRRIAAAVLAAAAVLGSSGLAGAATAPVIPARYVLVPYAAPEASHLRMCEDAITTAVMQGAVPTSGEYSPGMRRECRRLTRKQGRAAELWTERIETLFES